MASELNEKNFIRESSKNFTWIVIVLLIAIMVLTWGFEVWQNKILKEKQAKLPFYQVTQREFSLFLWQNPEFLQQASHVKMGLLPQGEIDHIPLDPESADSYVGVCMSTLYHYHAWKRLLSGYVTSRPVAKELFYQFLNKNQEWLPKYWKQAPEEYVALIENFEREPNFLPVEKIPQEVQIAFQGWMNFTHEWIEIEEVAPTVGEMEAFLEQYPHYGRSYWRNIVKNPEYLESFVPGATPEPNKILPRKELTGFLRIAFYNHSIYK